MSQEREDQDVSDEIVVEVEDDTPEEDRGRPRRPEGVEPEIPSDDDIAQYRTGVQTRIKKLRSEYHDERRRKEEAERLREEALRYAEAQKREAEQLRQRLAERDDAFVQQTKARLDVEIEQAKAAFVSAYESGDGQALATAQAKLAELQARNVNLGTYRPQAPVGRPAPPSATFAPTPAPAPSRDPRAEQWVAANPWFRKDPEMTGYVYGVHEKLVTQGVDPTSEAYYNQIDEAVRRRFSDRFEPAEEETELRPATRQTRSVVAPVSRNTGTPRTVKLTTTEVALANRMNVPLAKFAEEKLKLEGRRNG